MLSIQPSATLRRRFAGLPESVAVGLLVLAFGGAADLVVHLLNAPFLVIGGIDRSEAIAHALVIAGVALTLGGATVAVLGIGRGRDKKGATAIRNLDS